MGQLIDDLLAFSRMGQVVLRADRVRLDELVKDALRGLEMAMKDRIIDWKIAPLPDVQGDFSALKHVFSNLLGNAIKYTRTRELRPSKSAAPVSKRWERDPVCARQRGRF